MYNIYTQIKIDEKIRLVEGLKEKEVEKVFGITPVDYHIFQALGRIDQFGNATTEGNANIKPRKKLPPNDIEQEKLIRRKTLNF